MHIAELLRKNLTAVRERIAAAAARCERDPRDITLIGVTKYVSAEIARELVNAGVTSLGESRPQELSRKRDALADLPIDWHLIGHLQRNKIKLLPDQCLLHSVDSLRLLTALEEEAAHRGIVWPILLEVNISGDAAKHGFVPAEMAQPIEALHSCPHLQLQGLMTMAALEGGCERARINFHALRELRDQLAVQHPQLPLQELSMGMSDDFEVAIEEGARLIRVGSALFEGLPDDFATA